MSKSDVKKLNQISQKGSKLIIGLMSGTSLDGLDIALCRIEGYGTATKAEVVRFESLQYTEAFKEEIRQVFSRKLADMEKLCLLNARIAMVHSEYILKTLSKWSVEPASVDLIASHGQTVYHAPARLHKLQGYPNATLQIGDGDHLAVRTGIITVSDFRQKHIASGGEGAPLALFGDYLLFSAGAEDRILLNIGGISNFTYLPGSGDTRRVLSTDCGPGNTMIDALMQRDFGLPFDNNGNTASNGKVNQPLLEIMLHHPFFGEKLPKTTGPELFNLSFADQCMKELGAEIPKEDQLATLTFLTARSIADAVRKVCLKASVYVSGGGCHNRMIMRYIEEMLPEHAVRNFESLGVDPDAKEALLFAVLANEAVCGETLLQNFPTMGKISFPS